MYRTWLERSHFPGTIAFWIIHGISDVPLGKYWIQCDGKVLYIGPMGLIFPVWIGKTPGVFECTVRDSVTAIYLVYMLFQFHGKSHQPLGKGSIQGDGIVLDIGPMGPNVSCG